MSGPQAEIRSWRAWACFHLAQHALPAAWYPPDGRQLAREGIWLPGWQAALNRLHAFGWPGEADAALLALDDATA
jgi:hypothetical protein